MDERTMQLRLGAAVLASLVIIGVLLLFLGAKSSFIRSNYVIYVKLADAPGVVENTPIYQSGNFTVKRVPHETGERFVVYRRSAKEGEEGYSKKDYSAPHYEGPKTPEGMKEWASWYYFNKMDDGTYEAELDEAWWWGGGHNDGGTIHTAIPEEWFDMPYDEFLKNLVTLAEPPTTALPPGN